MILRVEVRVRVRKVIQKEKKNLIVRKKNLIVRKKNCVKKTTILISNLIN